MLNGILLVDKIRKGDIGAFEQVFRFYYTPLCLYAASLTGRMDIAEEIVQELFYVFWKEREQITVLRSLKNYLYGAVRNRSFQYLEHLDVRHRYQEAMAGKEKIEDPTPHDDLEYNELLRLIDQTIRQLPERRQRIFKMHRFEGMKYAEIAEALSLSVKTVEAEMTKALQLLRKEIEAYTYRI
ncbi:RNA polymerase sigma-70 factor (ECF subfamily) [Parabacteroides sp. PFB2-12]|uniref:RNA polymerase sigma-70 factor n=1 Tax=unclassified Parabacteroides TaxID=2649774 RepID=UPI002476AA51|nr:MULTISPECIES: RNA polymerase sigma-70 factor [unclassified Parabacteroides]MDH6341384.1 RNA polymerase sigma-70 factor (ECF subfamily) [Parabacteroides sp. PM6-13]MDH6389178.1 RNA polymerase sigma-70 factor (ECF subfamily) [Parabacteroides sp. PFB2-12]